MEIIISQKTQNYLKKLWGKDNIQPTIQSVVDNYIRDVVEKQYTQKFKKTIDQKVDELNTN